MHSCSISGGWESWASNLRGSSPGLCGGGPLGSTQGPAWQEGKHSEGAQAVYSLTPQGLMVWVNFVYKVPFVGEGGESPQLRPETGRAYWDDLVLENLNGTLMAEI